MRYSVQLKRGAFLLPCQITSQTTSDAGYLLLCGISGKFVEMKRLPVSAMPPPLSHIHIIINRTRELLSPAAAIPFLGPIGRHVLTASSCSMNRQIPSKPWYSYRLWEDDARSVPVQNVSWSAAEVIQTPSSRRSASSESG